MKTNSGTGLWTQTPPAIFPPILGLFGLGLAWRGAVDVFQIPAGVGELILGAVSLLFVLAAIAYLAKVLRRPMVLIEDLRVLPGRAGASAASTAGILFAASLVPYSGTLASGVMWLGLAGQVLIAVLVVLVLLPADLQARRMTPVWHLTFVGLIVAPLAAVPLGQNGLSEFILIVALPMALTIWAGHGLLMLRGQVPPPLRPVLAIHLAPACLFGIVCGLLGHTGFSEFWGWVALGGAAVLVARARYLTTAGFSPLWGAFTFPMAAFANLMLQLAQTNDIFRIMGGIALIASTLTIPVIAYRIMKMWASGKLAAKTNAARI